MSSGKDDILKNLKNVIATVYETDSEEVDINITFLEMGLDSISIIQVKQLVKNEYGFEVAVDRLFNDISNLDQLADFIKDKLSVEIPVIITKATIAEPVNVSIQQDSLSNTANETSQKKSLTTTRKSTADDKFDLQRIINDQLQLMQRQMDILAKLTN
jgi:iturin family lipopeptide synthetase A